MAGLGDSAFFDRAERNSLLRLFGWWWCEEGFEQAAFAFGGTAGARRAPSGVEGSFFQALEFLGWREVFQVFRDFCGSDPIFEHGSNADGFGDGSGAGGDEVSGAYIA
jgi:hypothetical protein